jgi:hypothetical protein
MSEPVGKYNIETFEDACDYLFEIIPDFEKAMFSVNEILADPTGYNGPRAAMAAIKISALRFKIGAEAQHWKLRSAQTKRLSDRLIKDSLMSAYDGLAEVINTLKITARHDHELTKGQ